MKALIIPGNPPSDLFYSEWREELIALDIFEDVIYKSYPVFEESDPELYIKACIHFYEEILRNNEGEFVLLGHSFGGYISSELLKKDLNIKHSILLFPFLGDPGFRGKFVLSLASISKIFISLRVARVMKAFAGLISADARKLKAEEIMSCIHMAHAENKTLKNIKNISPISAPKKVSYIYTDGDTWSSKKVMEQSKVDQTYYSPELSHGFIVYEHERVLVNRKIDYILASINK